MPRTRPVPTRASSSERRAFLSTHRDYAQTAALDELRGTEYRRLDEQRIAYLDYTAAGVYAESLIVRHAAWLQASVLGNPHSESETSARATAAIDRTRDHILRFFGASPDEYAVVFTPNATGALRLVGEAYPFGPGGQLAIATDDHNSVNGIREHAARKRAEVRYVRLTEPELRLDDDDLADALSGASRPGIGRLFAYPAESNFSGVLHPLSWVAYARERGWDVLLDAAAFTPTNRLDLGAVHADFVPVSFYKMFGYPTGVGCLIAQKAALERLTRPTFSGGTVAFASVRAFGHAPVAHHLFPDHRAFEDGTLNFLSIPAVDMALDYLEGIGVETVHRRVRALTGWLLDRMLSLRHGNGRPVVELYGPHDLTGRGAVILFNVLDPDGGRLDDRFVQGEASDARIALRAGCHCNPGGREVALGKSADEMIGYFRPAQGMSHEAFTAATSGAMQGAVRASLGIASNFDDVWRLAAFLSTFQA